MPSAYSLVQSNPDDHGRFNSRNIWKFKGPTRGSLLLWVAAHARLKTTAHLWERHVLAEPNCRICREDYELSLHALRDCTLAVRMWDLIIPPQARVRFWEGTEIQPWLALNIKHGTCQNVATEKWKYIFRPGVLELWY